MYALLNIKVVLCYYKLKIDTLFNWINFQIIFIPEKNIGDFSNRVNWRKTHC